MSIIQPPEASILPKPYPVTNLPPSVSFQWSAIVERYYPSPSPLAAAFSVAARQLTLPWVCLKCRWLCCYDCCSSLLVLSLSFPTDPHTAPLTPQNHPTLFSANASLISIADALIHTYITYTNRESLTRATATAALASATNEVHKNVVEYTDSTVRQTEKAKTPMNAWTSPRNRTAFSALFVLLSEDRKVGRMQTSTAPF